MSQNPEVRCYEYDQIKLKCPQRNFEIVGNVSIYNLCMAFVMRLTLNIRFYLGRRRLPYCKGVYSHAWASKSPISSVVKASYIPHTVTLQDDQSVSYPGLYRIVALIGCAFISVERCIVKIPNVDIALDCRQHSSFHTTTIFLRYSCLWNLFFLQLYISNIPSKFTVSAIKANVSKIAKYRII